MTENAWLRSQIAAGGPGDAAAALAAGPDWWVMRTFRELDDALLELLRDEAPAHGDAPP